MPGDTIRHEMTNSFINDKETDEPYLAEYLNLFKTEKLQNTYTGKGFEGNKGVYLENLSQKHKPYGRCQFQYQLQLYCPSR